MFSFLGVQSPGADIVTAAPHFPRSTRTSGRSTTGSARWPVGSSNALTVSGIGKAAANRKGAGHRLVPANVREVRERRGAKGR